VAAFLIWVSSLLKVLIFKWVVTESNQMMSKEVDFENAQFSCDAEGVPFLTVDGLGQIRFHPAYVALYALSYTGVEDYNPALDIPRDMAKFRACIQTLTVHLKEYRPGLWAWEYPFDHVYNNNEIQAPWISAFGQAVGIEALMTAYRLDQNTDYIALAEKAAQTLYRDIQNDGLLFRQGDDIWFEEFPAPKRNPTHILNGHMRALLAIHTLAKVSGNVEHDEWFQRGIATLQKWLPFFDTGYWLRYDLQPKRQEILFRFNNPYGYPLPNLAIQSIALYDPQSGDRVTLKVGTPGDAASDVRIAGNDWGQPESLEDKPCRRLISVQPASHQAEIDGHFLKPESYFYLSIPTSWSDTLRQERLELEITYWDEVPGNLAVQHRSIAPGQVFRDLPDGDLFLSGARRWRTWKIPLYPQQLGWWVGTFYAEKHQLYLEKLSHIAPALQPWAQRAKDYVQANKPVQTEALQITLPTPTVMPSQTTPIEKWTTDANGVLMQFFPSAADDAILFETEAGNITGKAVYQVFGVALQILGADKLLAQPQNFHPPLNPLVLKKDPALAWLLDENNFIRLNGETVLYPFQFNNTYNNIKTHAPWQSAFGQAYVLKALLFALQHNMGPEALLKSQLSKTLNAYIVEVQDGGLLTRSLTGNIFVEEVPNSTHILNAHLVSCSALLAADEARLLTAAQQTILHQLLTSLEKQLAQFDTGYWAKYDQNPKPEILLQVDWVSGKTSPAIAEVCLENIQTGKTFQLKIDTGSAFEGLTKLSGTDWSEPIMADGQSLQTFRNGYLQRKEAVARGHRHNVFLRFPLPDAQINDLSAALPYRLIIHYLDRAPGSFTLKIQTIHQGDHLSFVPLHQGMWHCQGDHAWKTEIFPIRQQDLGWFMGEAYQQYHVEYLQELALKTGSWVLAQYAEKWEHYLKLFQSGSSPICQPSRIYPPLTASSSPQKISSPRPKTWPEKVLKEISRFRRKLHKNIIQKQKPFTIMPTAPVEVFSANDPQNPLHPFRLAISQDISDLAAELLASDKPLSPHQKTLRVMHFLNGFQCGCPSDSELSTLLREKVGSCGDFTNMALAMIATQGIQGRAITLGNYPKHYGHAVFECRINDRWQLYDPTYAAYYTDTPDDEENPHVLSFEDLRQGQGKHPTVHCILKNPDRLAEGQALAKAFLGPEIYELANPAGPIGLDNPMTYPLEFDGQHSQNLCRKEFGTRYQGAAYLGAACICNQQQWTFTSLVPGQCYQFEITPEHLGGEPLSPREEFSVQASIREGGTLLSGTTLTWSFGETLSPWILRFMAGQETLILMLTHPYRGPNTWYVSIAQFKLQAIPSEPFLNAPEIILQSD
jgi:hypothetical protein